MAEKIIEQEIRCRHCLHRYKVKTTINIKSEIYAMTDTEKLEDEKGEEFIDTVRRNSI